MRVLESTFVFVCCVTWLAHGKQIEDEEDFNETLEKIPEFDEEDINMIEDDVFKRDAKPFLFGRRRRTCGSRRRTKVKSCTRSSNGCGPNGLNKFPFPFKGTFTPACNKHDVCYICGGRRSWSRQKCDDSFLKDMNSKCNCKYRQDWKILSRVSCLKWAGILYGAVRAAGGNFYTSGKPLKYSWCENDCVIPYGSPYNPE